MYSVSTFSYLEIYLLFVFISHTILVGALLQTISTEPYRTTAIYFLSRNDKEDIVNLGRNYVVINVIVLGILVASRILWNSA